MDSSDVLSIIVILILIGLSAFFSASETAVSSASRVRMKSYADDGDKRAKRSLSLIENFDKTLSSILVGNNIVNIASTSIATALFLKLIPEYGALLSTIIMTVLVLIFGEVLPKSTAKENADNALLSFSGPLSLVCKILTPISWVFRGLKLAITKPEDPEDKKPSITEEELKYIIEEIQDEGVLEEQESELAQSALEFDEIRVHEVYMPRVDVIAVDASMSREEIQKVFLDEKYTRLPVYEGNIDNIIGILNEKDFLISIVKNEFTNVRNLIKPALFVPYNLKISKALAKMQADKIQMAVVTDQYGGTAGIVTMEDILEELVGEIYDEHDDVLQLIEPMGEFTYRVNGTMDIEDMLEEIGFEDEIESIYNSVGGWASEILGKIPEKGETFEYDGLKVTVDEVEDNRVSSLIVEYDNTAESEED